MKRLIEKTVFCELVTAWRFAACPTSRSPLFVNATIDGVVRAPSEFSRTTGSPPSITAMHELVVPRSIPKILAINRDVGHCKSRASFSGSYNLLKISSFSHGPIKLGAEIESFCRLLGHLLVPGWREGKRLQFLHSWSRRLGKEPRNTAATSAFKFSLEYNHERTRQPTGRVCGFHGSDRK